MEGVLEPPCWDGNSPNPGLKPLAKNLLQCLRSGSNVALEREFDANWPGYLDAEVTKKRIAVIREIACGPGMHTMFAALFNEVDKRKQYTCMMLATFMCVVDDMLTLLLSHPEFLPTLTRMLWNKIDIPEDHRGPPVPAMHVRRSAIVSLSFIVREQSKPPGITPFFEHLAWLERIAFLEKLCDLGIPAAAVANLNDREALNDEVLVGKGMMVVRTICSGADTSQGGSEKCLDTLIKLRAFEAIAQHAIAPSNLRPHMLAVVETLTAIARVAGIQKLEEYPGLMDSIQTLWVRRQVPDPPIPPGQPWDSNKVVAYAAAELVAYVAKVNGRPSPIPGVMSRNTQEKVARREKDCFCAGCGRRPDVKGIGGTPGFFRWCRCSRCKVMRYCSKKCREVHWMKGHWNECVPLWLVP